MSTPEESGGKETPTDSTESVGVIHIPVINSLHYEYAEAALKAGKHVLMEKPFVLHSWQAEALRKLAAEKNLFLTEAVKAPHLPVYAEIRKIISSQELGTLHFMEFRQSYNTGPYITGWNVDRACGGGVLYGNEAYYLAISQLFAGPIRSIGGSAVFPDGEAESQISISAVHPDGIISELCVSRIILFDNGLKMYFENGRIEVPDFWKADKAYVIQKGERIRTIEIPCESEMTYELKHYNACILSGLMESPVTGLDMTIRNTELVESLYQRWEEPASCAKKNSRRKKVNMKKTIVAVNASPRAGWNTDTLVAEAARGAESAGAEIIKFDLYRLEKYTGCISCFGCKKTMNKGHCVVKDGLTPVLDAIRNCDGLIIGSPNYLSELSASFRALYERLVFQNLTYNLETPCCYEHPVPVLLIMTSNAPEGMYVNLVENYQMTLNRFVGPAKVLVAGDTLQLKDYSRTDWEWSMFNPEEKKQRHLDVFPQKCREAYELGVQLAENGD